MQFDFDKILFLDIETVPMASQFGDLSPDWQALWAEKVQNLSETSGQSVEELFPRAGVMAEFGKIVCISIGILVSSHGERQFRVKSFFSDNEAQLLNEFGSLLDQKFADYYLCAHNGKEFDFPFTARRILINGLNLPKPLDIAGLKPWEVKHLDTMELWKFGDRKNFTSLKLLSSLFGIPTPKDDISGKDVARVYWVERDLERIAIYCQKDVVALANLLLKWSKSNLLEDHEIHYS